MGQPLPTLLAATAIIAATSTAQADIEAARTPTATMSAALEALAPEAGWLGVPPGMEGFVWDYYQQRFSLAPEGNAGNEARIALGRLLFFDKRLSADQSLSCASCHDPTRGFGERSATSTGVGGAVGGRNAPTLMNAAFQKQMFWDGRVATLEEQALLPIVNPIEMGMDSVESAVARIADDPDYVALFDLAYGGAPTADGLGKALAAFQRTLVFLDSPFDRFRAGDRTAISAAARRGFELFDRHACTACHPVSTRRPLLSDENFHNTGIAARTTDYRAVARSAFARMREAAKDTPLDQLALEPEHGELGRALVTKAEYNVGAFRSPQLRNIGVTAPYMHDGSLATLWDVVEHYNKGGNPSPWLDPSIVPLDLSPRDVDDIVAFLFSLTDRRLADTNQREFERQGGLARR